MKKIFFRCLFTTVLFLHSQAYCSSRFSTEYDSYIKTYAKKYLGAYKLVYGWELFKAQLYQESLLDPLAVSHAGASGIGQFMPETWEQISKQLGFDSKISPFNAEYNIQASAFYMSTLLAEWTWERPMSDRYSFALASYNFGLGATLRAQKRCNNSVLFKDLSPCLPKETRNYVPNIWNWYVMMKFL